MDNSKSDNLFLNNLKKIIFKLDLNGNIVWMNRQFELFFRTNPLLGNNQSISHYFHPEDFSRIYQKIINPSSIFHSLYDVVRCNRNHNDFIKLSLFMLLIKKNQDVENEFLCILQEFQSDLTQIQFQEIFVNQNPTILETYFEGIVYHLGGYVIKCNNKFANFFGYTSSELTGMNWISLLESTTQNELFRQTNMDQMRSLEVIGHTRDDSIVKLELIGYQSMILEFPCDITMLRRKLVQIPSIPDFTLAINYAAIGMALLDLYGKYVLINRAYCDIVGYSEDELLGNSFQSITYPDDYDIGQDIVDKLLKGEIDSGIIEKRYIHKKGNVIFVQATASLIRDEENKPLFIFSQTQDITIKKEIEVKLRENEKNLQSFIDGLPEIAYMIDTFGKLLVVNNAFIKKVEPKYNSQNLINVSIYDILSPSRKIQRKKVIDEIIQTKKSYSFEDVNEENRYISSTFYPILDETGNVSRIIGFCIDITDRKKAEEAIEQKFINFIPIGMHIYSLNSKNQIILTRTNPAADIILSIDHKPLMGKSVEEAFPFLSTTELPRILKRIATEGGMWQESEFFFQDGNNRLFFDISIFQLSLNLVAVCFLNITDRLRVKEQIALEKEYVTITLRSIGDAVITTDAKGHIKMMNVIAEKLTGVSEKEAIGQYLNDVFSIEDEKTRIPIDIVRRIQNSGDIYHLPPYANLRSKNGKQYVIDDSGALIRNEINQIIGIILVFRDYTQERKNQLQLFEEQKVESLGLLAGGIAHDFNNILNVIMGYSEIGMIQTDPKSKIYEYFQEIRKSASNVELLVQQLLAFGRKQLINPKPLNINQTILNFSSILRRLIPENIEIEFALEDDIDTIYADPVQIEQILINLVANARDAIQENHNSHGKRKITIATQNFCTDDLFLEQHIGLVLGFYILLSVTDTGKGMTKDTIQKLFTPFFTTKQHGKGTGLGLATVYGIVRQNKGLINVYSEIDKGSVFKLYWPIYVSENPIDQYPQRQISIPILTGTGTILFVEDDESFRKLIVNSLQMAGFTIITAENGKTALEYIKSHQITFDLLITDIVMPEMGGIELTSQLFEIFPSLKVIFTSGYIEDEQDTQFIRSHNIKLINKPYSINSLIQQITEIQQNSD